LGKYVDVVVVIRKRTEKPPQAASSRLIIHFTYARSLFSLQKLFNSQLNGKKKKFHSMEVEGKSMAF